MKVTSTNLNNINSQRQQSSKQVAFSGNPLVKKSVTGDVIEGIGKFAADEKGKNKLLSQLKKFTEFEGINMTFHTLCLYCFGFVITPRVVQAKKRDKDHTGDEVREILTRDIPTVATIIYAVPMLTKGFARTFGKKTGLVLSMLPKEQKFFGKEVKNKTMRTFLNYIRPNKGINVLSTSDATNMYSGIKTYKNGLHGFCEVMNNKGGNLGKLFAIDKENLEKPLENIYRKNTQNPTPAKSVFEASNEDIMSAIKAAEGKKEHKKDFDAINGVFDKKDNAIAQKAKGYLSIPKLFSMFVITPSIMGFFLPILNIRITNKRCAARSEKKDGQQSGQTATVQKADIKKINNNIIEQNIGAQFATFKAAQKQK